MKFTGLTSEKISLIKKLIKRINVDFENYTFSYKESREFRVVKKGYTLEIEYSLISQLFRSLLLAAYLVSKTGDGEIAEDKQFDNMGVMLDMSRCGVMKVEKVKEYIEYMALCGLNSLMLYMEDVYVVDGLSYFGYLRGRYSKKELKEIDEYGYKYGVEVIPCIQTLGHFEQYIKWKEGKKISDTKTVLLAECDETFEFIEKIIKNVAECFKTKKIHIGMDEAWGLGTGNYLKKNGYKDGTKILCDHINKVKEITDKYNLKPMMWSDMYFRLSSDTNKYYDETVKVPPFVKKLLPKDMGIVYWDYYHTDSKLYEHMFSEHKEITDNVIFAGGVWTWSGLLPDFLHTYKTANVALKVCKEKGIKDVYATCWGDDGCETDMMFSLTGALLYGEHSYNKEIDDKKLNEELKLLFNVTSDSLLDISKALYPSGEFIHGTTQLSVKQIIYNDLLVGVADYEMTDKSLVSHYENLYKKYLKEAEKESYYKEHFKFVAAICKTASDKVKATQDIALFYKTKNHKALNDTVNKLLPSLKEDYIRLKEIHFKLWHLTNKPFGFEIIDLRYSGKIGRIATTISRLQSYLNGEISEIEELEEERLPFNNQHFLANWHTGISSAYMTVGY